MSGSESGAVDRRPLLAAGTLLVVHALAYLRWTEDDVGVALRYAFHLAHGQGLVYNPGERIEAFSDPLWVLALAAASAFLGGGPAAKVHLLVAAKFLGLVCGLLGLYEADRLARLCGAAGSTRTAALILVAASTPYAAWCVGGLEVSAVAWASAALVAAAAELAESSPDAPLRAGARNRAALAAIALVWLRADGFVLPVFLSAALLVTRMGDRGAVTIIALPAALAQALLFAFRRAYYDAWWPLPVAAKVDLRTSLADVAATWRDYVRPFLGNHGVWLAVVALLVLAWISHTPGSRARRLAVASAMALIAYSFVVGKDWMPLFRFLVPAVIPIAGAVSGMRALPRVRLRPAVALFALAALSPVLGHQAFRARRSSPLFYLHPTVAAADLVEFWSPVALWLRAHVPAGGLLLTSEAGFLPYLTDLRTADSYGLATPAIARLARGTVERSTLGVLTRFVEGPPEDAAQRLIAALPAAAIVLQERMVQQWNRGSTPDTLFAGRFRLSTDSPVGAWAVYLPITTGFAPTPGGSR